MVDDRVCAGGRRLIVEQGRAIEVEDDDVEEGWIVGD